MVTPLYPWPNPPPPPPRIEGTKGYWIGEGKPTISRKIDVTWIDILERETLRKANLNAQLKAAIKEQQLALKAKTDQTDLWIDDLESKNRSVPYRPPQPDSPAKKWSTAEQLYDLAVGDGQWLRQSPKIRALFESCCTPTKPQELRLIMTNSTGCR